MNNYAKRFLIGVKVIDNQHLSLFESINKLAKQISRGCGKDEIANIVHFLDKYCIQHLASEEELMIQIGYPELETHKLKHSLFIEYVKSLKKEIKSDGYSDILAHKTHNHLVHWLLDHILGDDKLIGTFLEKNSISVDK